MSETVKYLLIGAFVVLLFVGLFLWGKARLRKRRGKKGERVVQKILSGLKGKRYVFNDLLFEQRGRSCQIDHVLISENGIFVIETKNYSGVILGEEEQREWRQVLRHGEIEHQFYNPVKQNETHISHLSEILQVKGIFQNVVVFLSDADIRNVRAKEVCSIDQLSKVLSRKTGVSLSASEMDSFNKKLKKLKKSSHISELQHVKNIKKTQKFIKKGKCPRCGAKLIKEDKHYSCSNPKCKFGK